MRHELRHTARDVSKGIPSETVLGGKSTSTTIMQAGEGAANRQKSCHKSGLTAVSSLRIKIRLDSLKVECTFSGGYANNP